MSGIIETRGGQARQTWLNLVRTTELADEREKDEADESWSQVKMLMCSSGGNIWKSTPKKTTLRLLTVPYGFDLVKERERGREEGKGRGS